jgi:SecD/SecF fusion protein
MEIDQAFIAAILTVVGYSINDTVVVFDRIREFQAEHQAKKYSIAKVANGALNSALSRTVITSLTTFIVLLVLFLAGGETIKGFSFALLVGVIIGTYSSAFIATPMMLEFTKEEPAKEKKKK